MALASLACCSFNKAWAGYDKNYVGETLEYKAKYEDTFVHLARKHHLGFVEIRAANPNIDPWIPGEGTDLIIPTRHLLPDAPRKDVVINLPEMRIYVYLNSHEAPVTFPIGIGREGLSTPTGKTTIVRKIQGPYWRPTDRMRKEDPKLPEVVPPGPENPMGTHALYLGWAQYAIHGTNRPYAIGRRVSSGCIRMYPEDIKQFYKIIPVGTRINVIDQPIKVQWIGNELYLEAHPDLDQAIKMEEVGVISNQKLTDQDMRLIINKAGSYQDYLNWPRIRSAIRERAGYPVLIAKMGSVPRDVHDKEEQSTINTGDNNPRAKDVSADHSSVSRQAVTGNYKAEVDKRITASLTGLAHPASDKDDQNALNTLESR